MPKLRAALIGMGLGLACAFLAVQVANAADKGGPRGHQDIVAPASEPWTGPYIGAGMGWSTGLVDLGPLSLGADGASVSVVAGYDKQWGNVVAGLNIGYSHFMTGDLESVIKSDVFGGARLGFLVSSNALLYGHLSYGRMDTEAGDIDGFRFGPGVELRLGPSSPFSLDLRYEVGSHDVEDLAGPNVDARSHSFLARINWRFGQ